MDVICDHCRTEYEFDEALVSARGTTVKCTHCGHLFKVYRPEWAALPILPGSGWTVRRIDGTSQELANLVDIMRLIGEGRLARDDEVSRTGKAWRRLGDVDELEPFFLDADRRGPSRAHDVHDVHDVHDAQDVHEARATSATDGRRLSESTVDDRFRQLRPQRSNRDSDPDATRPLYTHARQGTLGELVRASSQDPTERANAEEPTQTLTTLAAAAPTSASGVASSGSLQDDDDDDLQTEERVLPRAELASSPRVLPAVSATRAGSWPLGEREITPPGGAAGDRHARVRPKRPSAHTPGPVSFPAPPGPHSVDDRAALPSGKWVWVIASGIAVATLGFFYVPPLAAPRAAVTQLPPDDPSAHFMERAGQLLATHRVARFDEALTEYIKALAFHEHDPYVLCSVARVHAVWAQELLFESEGNDAGAASGSPECAVRSSQAKLHVEQAQRYAQAAARMQPTGAEAAVCVSDALRLAGDLAAARTELERARAAEGALDAESLRVAALLAIAENHGDVRAGRELAAQAVAKDPGSVRMRLLYARCLAPTEPDAARRQLQEVRRRAPDHPAAEALERWMSRPAEAARAESAPAKSTAIAEATPSVPTENLSHEGYISRGQAALEAGQVSVAKRLFEQALFVRPNSTQAHSGLGYVALEKNRPTLAIEHFSSAMRAGNDDALIGLGEAYRRVGRNREALRAYQNYLSRKPNGNQISIARAQVDRLGGEAASQKTP